MKKILILICFAMLTACTSARIMNVTDAPVAKKLELKKVENDILNAAVTRGWTAKVIDKNMIEATLNTHGSIVVVVSIPFSETAYSINYKSSENLKYNPATGVIHKRYNTWVNNLKSDINKALILSN